MAQNFITPQERGRVIVDIDNLPERVRFDIIQTIPQAEPGPALNDELYQLERAFFDPQTSTVVFLLWHPRHLSQIIPERDLQTWAPDRVYRAWADYGVPREKSCPGRVVYHVFEIRDHRYRALTRRLELHVQWVGYPFDEQNATWEFASKMLTSIDSERVAAYIEEHGLEMVVPERLGVRREGARRHNTRSQSVVDEE